MPISKPTPACSLPALRIAAVLGLVCPLLLACSESKPAEDPGYTSSLELYEETLELEDGSILTYDRGILSAPVRRDIASSSDIDVEFFRFRRTAEASPDTPPIVILHGGPGYEGLGDRLENPGYFEDRLSRYIKISDVIVPGQRGFGTSTATPCDPMRTLTVEEALDSEARDKAIREATAACRAKWQERGLDLTGFNTLEASADVADIARHLGYEQIQLRGISFGSHWGMTILRNHPEIVARAVLASLEGPDHTYDMPTGVLDALGRIAAAAEASPELTDRIPEGGLLEAYRRLIERADAEPIAVEIEHPQDDSPLTVTLDGDDLRQIFSGARRFTTFGFRMPRWPLALLDILEGNLQQAAADHLWNLMAEDLEDAAEFQYDCGSGLSEERGALVRSDPAAAILGPIWQSLDVACEGWESALGPDFRSTFQSAVPTVLVQGNWDVPTPYENALELRPYFENHHFVHVEGGSHGAIREAIEGVPGFREAMDHWLATGEFAQIPESVTLPPVQWQGSKDAS